MHREKCEKLTDLFWLRLEFCKWLRKKVLKNVPQTDSDVAQRKTVREHGLNMIEGEYELRAPGSEEEWRTFHDIRRKVLFENRGEFDRYNENHPDDSKEGNYPLVLIYKGIVIGVVRMDVCEQVVWLRRVAIREDLHRLGHGRVLLQIAESFAKGEGCKEVRTNAALDAVGFYERCGYERQAGELNSVTLRKLLE